MKTKINWLFLFIGLVVLFLPNGCTEDEDDIEAQNPIRIGFMIAMEADPTWGQQVLDSAQLAVTEINAAGGVNIQGELRPIELVFKDSFADPNEAIKSGQALLNDGINITIGPMYSGVVLGGYADFSVQNGMLLVSPLASSHMIPEIVDNDLVWQINSPFNAVAAAGAGYAFGELNVTTAAVLYRDDAFGQDMSAAFEAEFVNLGGTLIRSIPYPAEGAGATTDFTAQLDQLFANPKPELIYFAAYNEETEKITKDMDLGDYMTGPNPPIILHSVGLSSIDSYITNVNSDILNGMYGTALGTFPDSYQNNKTFVENFQAEYGYLGEFGTAYDAVYLVAFGMTASGSTAPNDIKGFLGPLSRQDGTEKTINVKEFSLAQTELLAGNDINYDGASGKIEFTPKGFAGQQWYSIWTIQQLERQLAAFVDWTAE